MATAEAVTPRAATRLSRVVAAVCAEPILVGLVVLAAVLRFATLDQQSYWIDEAYTVALVGESFPQMLRHIADTESTPPLYYALAWGWAKLFGTGEVGLRSFSALLGTATVPVMFAAGKAFVSRPTGLVAAALAATSPLLIWYSQEARAYALLVLLGAASLVFFARALDGGERRDMIAWGVVSALAVVTFYLAVLLFAAEAVVLAWEPARRRLTAWMVGLVVLVGLALTPLALAQHPQERTTYQALSLVDRAKDVPAEFVFGRASYQRPAFFWIALGLLALVAAGLVWAVEGRERRRALLAFGLSLGVIVPTVVLHFAGSRFDYFHYRPVIEAWLPAAIGVAAVLSARRLGRLGIAAVVVACGIGVASEIAIVSDASVQREDWRGITAAIGPRDPNRAVFMLPWLTTGASELYRPTVALPPAGMKVREVVLVAQHAHLPPAVNPDTKWFNAPRGFREVEHRRLQVFELTRYQAARPTLVTPGEIVRFRRFLLSARLDRAPAHRPPPTRESN